MLYIPTISVYVGDIAMLSANNAGTVVIFDSGFTSTILPSNSALSNYRTKGGGVSLADNSLRLEIKGIGDTPLFKDVLHIPDISFGLISISALDNEGCICIFGDSRVTVIDYYGNLLCTGTKRNRLYYLDDKYLSILLSYDPDTTDDTILSVRAEYVLAGCTVAESIIAAGDTVVALERCSPVTRPKSTMIGLSPLELIHRR
jgi:hypothetical protein